MFYPDKNCDAIDFLGDFAEINEIQKIFAQRDTCMCFFDTKNFSRFL